MSLHHGEHRFGVSARVREDRNAVQGAAGGEHTPVAHAAARRLQPHDVVEGGGNASRARRVGAQRERHQPRRDGHRRPRARSARDVVGVEDAAWRAVGRTRAIQAGSELVEVGLPDQDRARFDQPSDGGGVLRRLVRVRGTGRGGRQAGRVDVVLDRERNAVEREPLIFVTPSGERAQLSLDALRRHQREPDRIRAPCLDAAPDFGENRLGLLP